MTAIDSRPSAVSVTSPRPARWSIDGSGIRWDLDREDRHADFFEMCGEQIGLAVRYGIDADSRTGEFVVSPRVVWPLLRFRPNETADHFIVAYGDDVPAGDGFRFQESPRPAIRFRIQGYPFVASRKVRSVRLDHALEIEGVLEPKLSYFEPPQGMELSFRRTVFPSNTSPAAFDAWELVNTGTVDIEIDVEGNERLVTTDALAGVTGSYVASFRVVGSGTRILTPGDSTRVTVVMDARHAHESVATYDVDAELGLRRQRISEIASRIRVETPDPVLNAAFSLASRHATENIIRTRGGLMHAPGGLVYFAAIWANDQAEYANPYFGMSGDSLAIESAINSFRHYARFMNPEYRLLPTSIVGEGANYWVGVGDRGDAAMVAYGAARFALALGDREVAMELWPLIEWCLEYLRRQLRADGVVASDCDELETRFPTGNANLCTSSLTYDALRSAVLLGRDLAVDPTLLSDYADRAVRLRDAIESYFGAEVGGFATYRYYDREELRESPRPGFAALADQPDVLRAWIGIPLTVGIYDRLAGTLDALFSPRLWTEDGLATAEGESTVWDRSTLYALRGVIAAGATDEGHERLADYSRRRLLGDHVPYPYEAYPEGGKSQLAAESALYCRVFTEGLFGLRPTGLRSTDLTPRLPRAWERMALRDVHAFGSVFDVEVERQASGALRCQVRIGGNVVREHTLNEGATIRIDFD